MSDTTTPYGGPGDQQSKADLARDQAAHVADTATDEGQHVVEVAKQEAGDVVDEAKSQARDLYQQAQSELRDQAAVQQERVASGLRAISDELSQMAEASESRGVASELVQQAAERAGGVASWIGQRDPGSLLGEVKAYARRNPGTFIAAAAVAGVLAGRLTRSLTSGPPKAGAGTSDDRTEQRDQESTTPRTPKRPPTATIIPADAVEAGYDPNAGEQS
ncbi:hypothetical protein [Leifsonia aquatica]|uniref:Uncharacterized protein n=2 Tax=Leifsonia aquatica TaxID=144185 RepID=U2RXS0_LEIAQ|nr:hypothetical protein [Leifsonia aquatica]ERK73526.1 hypothetical protein N136_00084 [Leifsonia aquatica ATCC 14665]MBB2967975.1 ElaB/YqjD/DUF883 family membrane-anchored ribosome-binding protein [Leifsonia aquatica]